MISEPIMAGKDVVTTIKVIDIKVDDDYALFSSDDPGILITHVQLKDNKWMGKYDRDGTWIQEQLRIDGTIPQPKDDNPN